MSKLTKKLESYIKVNYKPFDNYSKDFYFNWYRGMAAWYLSYGMTDDEIIDFLQKNPFSIAQAYALCPSLLPATFAVRHLLKATLPENIREAYRILDGMLTYDEIQNIISHSKSDFVTNEHFGLGLWIRNNWIYGIDYDDEVVRMYQEKCYNLIAGTKSSEYNPVHPDMVSSDFLGRYYGHLKRVYKVTDIPSDPKSPIDEVLRKPRKCPHCGGKIIDIVYGEPDDKTCEMEKRGEIALGGCCITSESPFWQCSSCGHQFRPRILIDR